VHVATLNNWSFPEAKERRERRMAELSTEVTDPAEKAGAEVVSWSEKGVGDGEITVEASQEELGRYEYQVRLLFTPGVHHQELVTKEDRKAMMARVDAIEAFAKSLDHPMADGLILQIAKIRAIVTGNEYMNDGKSKKLDECLENAELAGWEELASEPWRALVVAKAAKATYQQAVLALQGEPNMREAIKLAPKQHQRFSTVPDGWEPPQKPK